MPVTSFNCGTTNASALALNLRQLYCGSLPISADSSITTDAPDTVAKTRQIALVWNWDFGPGSLVSVTGFTSARNSTYNDYDGTATGKVVGLCTGGAACIGVPNYTSLITVNALSISRERVNTFSQEVRLQSDDDSDFSWLFGANYFDSRIPLAAGGIGVAAKEK